MPLPLLTCPSVDVTIAESVIIITSRERNRELLIILHPLLQASTLLYRETGQNDYWVYSVFVDLAKPREKQKPQAFDCNSYKLPMYTNLSQHSFEYKCHN